MFKAPERCPFCLRPGTVEVLENDTWEFLDKNRRTFEVSGYICFHCTACDEKSVDGAMDKLNHPKVLDARRVSESLLSGTDIKRILEKVKDKYGFSEAQLEDILGIGAKSFARWKNGAVCQSQTADALLRAIDKHPAIIEDIAKARGIPLVPIKRGRPSSKTSKPRPRKPQQRRKQAVIKSKAGAAQT
jgi:putative zinc finger/helix-turn-helix YgiT family protein